MTLLIGSLNVTVLIRSMIPDGYNDNEPDNLGDFDFDFEKQDVVSALGHNPSIEEMLFNLSPTDKFASDTGFYPQMQAPLPLRPHRSLPKHSERSSPTISGCELFNLEGRPSSEAAMATVDMSLPPSMISTPPVPTLRRKGKFGPDTEQPTKGNRAPELTKTGSCDAISYGFPPSDLPLSPSSYEYTQNFQHRISMSTHKPDFSGSQLQNYQDMQRDHPNKSEGQISPREIFQHRKSYSEQSSLGSAYNHLYDYSHHVSHAGPRDINAQIPVLSPQSPGTYEASSKQSQQSPQSNGAFRQPRQAQSWAHMHAGFANDYTVSPGEIHPSNWDGALHEDSTAYFPNLAFTTSSSSHEPSALYSHDDLAATCFAPLPLTNQAPFASLPVDEVLLNNLAGRRPHTPPPSNPSASPPTPEKVGPTTTLSKQARGGRSRQNPSHTLRHRKTTAALKPARSQTSLIKPSKSAGHLRGKKSIGQGLNHSGSKSPIKKEFSSHSRHQSGGGGGGNNNNNNNSMAFGFMNFTPSDSKKILTGVAPSGSSKTKARREQEASEERRRMSLAALKAIEQVGGDTEAFNQQMKVEVEVGGSGTGTGAGAGAGGVMV